MKFCRRFLIGYWAMKTMAWYGNLLMRLTVYGYRLHLLTPQQTLYSLSYSNTLAKRALRQLRVIRAKTRTERLNEEDITNG